MSVYTYGAVLLLSLGGAWYQWSKPPSLTKGEEVVVLYGEENTIEGISWESEKDKAVLELRSDDRGSYLWATYTDKKKEEDQTKSFKVGKDGEKLITSLSPLVAIRELQGLSEEKQTEIGITESTSTLTITRKGKTTTFSIGNEAYGTKDLYIQNQESKKVFLLDDAKVRSLKFARTRLPDRKLWSFEKGGITKITLNASIGDQSKALILIHKNWQDKQQAKWVRSDAPDSDNTQITNWVTKYLRSTNSSYALDVDVSTLTQAFSIDMEADGAQSEKITIYHDTEKNTWYAETTHSRGLVKLIKQSISGLYDDLPSLFSAPQEKVEEGETKKENTEKKPKK
jgi:hypothetical protein